MRVGIIGTGIVGRTIGARLIEIGQDVMFGTREVGMTLARTEPDGYGNPPFSEWVKGQPQARLGSFPEAAAHGKVVFNATAGVVSLAALELAGRENLAGKVLIDVANPLDFSSGFPPSLAVCNTDSLGEQIQRTFPDVRVVKALNTMSAFVMVRPSLVPGDHNVFISGDDEAARRQVATMLSDWFHWPVESIIDLGGIATARGTEMLLSIWLTLFGTLHHPYFNFHIAMGELTE